MSNDGFVTVTHKDGRTAEITPAEVAFYGSLGFAPTGDYTAAGDAAPASTTAPEHPALNSTDQRLDLVVDELRGLRADLSQPGESVEMNALASLDAPLLDEIQGLRADLARYFGKDQPPEGDVVELRGIGTTSTTTTAAPTPTTSTTPAPEPVSDTAGTIATKRAKSQN